MEPVVRAWNAVSAWLVPAAIFVLGVVDVAQNGAWSSEGGTVTYPGPGWVHIVFLAAVSGPLYWRFRVPVVVTVVVVTGSLLWILTRFNHALQPPFAPALSIIVALFSMAASTEGRPLIAGTAVAGVFLLTGEMVGFFAGQGIGNVFPAVLLFGATWIIGRIVHRQRSGARAAVNHAKQVEQRQEARAQESADRERARIARELHDVVTHSLSVIVVQAAAERRALPSTPAQTAAALDAIETTGREAMVELRRMLGVLHAEKDTKAPLCPQPGLPQVPTLISDAERAGLRVHTRWTGDMTRVPAGVGLSCYRILQEAITNVMKHANATAVELSIGVNPTQVEITVTDNGDVPSPHAAPGYGLVGMRERVTVYGGHLQAGPTTPGPGYAVRAVLPLDANEQTPQQ